LHHLDVGTMADSQREVVLGGSVTGGAAPATAPSTRLPPSESEQVLHASSTHGTADKVIPHSAFVSLDARSASEASSKAQARAIEQEGAVEAAQRSATEAAAAADRAAEDYERIIAAAKARMRLHELQQRALEAQAAEQEAELAVLRAQERKRLPGRRPAPARALQRQRRLP
jgi:metal-dependent amidase/aminoacylase/carboxypeptidase family protein